MLLGSQTHHRPRNVNALQAAAILYGDWGTSKAYVIGLAFALAAHQSFWLIAAVSLLTALVGFNYITICKCYPKGGGVYASARDQSRIIALIGALFLSADYLVTASLSSLSSFAYIGVQMPVHWAAFAVAIIGSLNFFGPKKTGNLAFIVSIPTLIIVMILGILCIPDLGKAIANLKPLTGTFQENWVRFVGIIVALSGIEAIANTTGVMTLDVNSDYKRPLVSRTATPAILFVMFEVCFFTSLFALTLNALSGLQAHDGIVSTREGENVRDSMLRYMGESLASQQFGPILGQFFGLLISVAFGVLLLSAVNTAIVALTSLMYVISSDGQLPSFFQKLNRFGVPIYPLIIATIVPIFLLYAVRDVARLADLYAIGFVGAIATNLGFTASNLKLTMKPWERGLMACTFLIMTAIEITLFLEKARARHFVIALIAVGLLLRALVIEKQEKKSVPILKKSHPRLHHIPILEGGLVAQDKGKILCVVRAPDKTLDFALQECEHYGLPLYLLCVKEVKTITQVELRKEWYDDEHACEIIDYLVDHLDKINVEIKFIYLISSSLSESIIETATFLNVTRMILGMRRKDSFRRLFQQSLVHEIAKTLPPNIDLLVIS